jgi:hypothetical protein
MPHKKAEQNGLINFKGDKFTAAVMDKGPEALKRWERRMLSIHTGENQNFMDLEPKFKGKYLRKLRCDFKPSCMLTWGHIKIFMRDRNTEHT